MVKTAAKYQAYAEYKDSGVEWVGDIPSTWDVKPVLALFSSLVEKNTDGYESNVLSLSYGRIVRRDIEDNFGLLPESFNTYQIVKNGDIILRLTDLQNDKRSLRVGLVKEKGIITSAYLKLSANQHIDPRFAYRLLHSYDTTKVFYGMGGGLRQSMKFEDFKRLPILLPSKDEQTQIANFLDHETAKIDHLIEKQQQLIELLKEKRQAVISHAVTKGLDPNVPMKDSGVEWLGEVPEHWELKKLKYLGEAIIGLTYSPDDIVDEGEGTLVLRSSNVQNKKLVFNDNVYVNRDIPEKLRTKRNDILICARNGSRALIGKNALIDERAEGVSFGAFMSIFRSKYNNYLSKVFNSSLFEYQSGTFLTATINQLTTGNLNSFEVPLPPFEERELIVSTLDNETTKIDSLIVKAESAIQLMQERRTALISAAVTGKIDVRNWQAPTLAEAHTELNA
ncbi:restriction endonuclease subunit S [Acinetobacter sp. SCLZS86]|uniref:restriction endonuclease subunit S n=1 Tax=Acinetobacter sp. SCLZS86 TaxID=2908637 RepID=UPI001F40F4E0|nr:restriction endonuclease subunit S [Acinetobacter sp. SCLZS86]UIZ56733.1 restriction endonuclease subunit S [Acinetobacter sp. SCLZS86]